MNCFSWVKLIPVLIHLKYWYYNIPHLELPYLPYDPCQILLYPTETLLQHNSHHILYWFPYFVLPPFDHTPSQVSDKQSHIPSQANKIYYQAIYWSCLNTSWIKHTSHQKTEFLRAASLSKLDDTVNNNSIYKVCWVVYKIEVLLHFHNPNCAYNHLYNVHQKSVPPL